MRSDLSKTKRDGEQTTATQKLFQIKDSSQKPLKLLSKIECRISQDVHLHTLSRQLRLSENESGGGGGSGRTISQRWSVWPCRTPLHVTASKKRIPKPLTLPSSCAMNHFSSISLPLYYCNARCFASVWPQIGGGGGRGGKREEGALHCIGPRVYYKNQTGHRVVKK